MNDVPPPPTPSHSSTRPGAEGFHAGLWSSVAFSRFLAGPPGCAGVQLPGLGRGCAGSSSLGLPSKGELGGRWRGKEGLLIDCLTQTIGLNFLFKALEIVSDMGPGLWTAAGNLPVTKPNSLF